MIPRLYIARTSDGNDFPLPSYASKYHAGLMLRAAIGSPLKINAGERVRIPTGFAIGVPQGFCGQIVSTPLLAEEHGLIVSDAPHLVNPADRKPLFVLLQNVSSGQYVLHRGEIIAELVITPVVQVCWNEIKAQTHAAKTDMKAVVLDKGVDETENSPEPSRDIFKSYRRVKKSPRNRFKSSDEENG